MKNFKRIGALLLCIVMLGTVLSGCKPENPDDDENQKIEYKAVDFSQRFSNLKLEPGCELLYIDGERLSFDEKILFSSLQGIIAKTKPELFIKYSGPTTTWFKTLEKEYQITFTKVKDPYSLLEQYKDRIKDNGYVTYESMENKAFMTQERKLAESVNNACTIAGQESYLVVSKGLESKIQKLGFEKKEDGTAYTAFELFEKYKETLNKGLLMHERFNNFQIRDFGIATGSLFYYGYKQEMEEELREIHTWLDPMSPIFGWYEDEVGGVQMSSEYGNITMPSDFATNFSVYAALRDTNQEPIKQKEYKKGYAGKDKHYVAFMLSDGDNITYHLNDVYGGKGLTSKVDRPVPMSWTFVPMAYDLAPHLAQYYYKDIMTENDNFIGALSGVGYINPGYWPKEMLGTFGATTAHYMEKMDESVMAMLIDSASSEELTQGTNPKINSLQTIADAFSPYDAIKGGFFYFGGEYVPDNTVAGTVTWSNGKPFINLRGGSWFVIDGKTKMDDPSELAMLAYKINNRTKNAEVVEGYSVMVISAGGKGYDTMMNLTRMLDDDVVVVTCEELVEIMTENVKDKTTNYQIKDEEYTAFHYRPSAYDDKLSKDAYEALRYDYMKMSQINKQEVSGKLSWSFAQGQGDWNAAVVTANRDTASAEFANGIYHTASSGEKRTDYRPDSYLFGKVKLPDQEKITLTVNGIYKDADVRIKVFSNNRVYTVYDYHTENTNGNAGTVTADLSKFRGNEISIVYEVRNGETWISDIAIQ